MKPTYANLDGSSIARSKLGWRPTLVAPMRQFQSVQLRHPIINQRLRSWLCVARPESPRLQQEKQNEAVRIDVCL